MLVQFSVSNFLSYKDTQTLSLVRGVGNEHLDNVLCPENPENIELLSSAVIYGANASGKSNLFFAIEVMRKIVSEVRRPNDRFPIEPYGLNKEYQKKPTLFDVHFLLNGIRYQYGFSLNKEKILEEWLFSYETPRGKTLFSRYYDESEGQYQWAMGSDLKGQKKAWQSATKSNALFLSTAVELNSEQLEPIYDYFLTKLRVIGINGLPKEVTDSHCVHSEKKNEVIKFLKEADFNVADLIVEEDYLPKEKLIELPREIRDELEKRKFYETKLGHLDESGNIVFFEFENESSGTRKFYSFAVPWIQTLKKGYVLFVDELNEKLHPLLVRHLVSLFHNPKVNTNNAQLIFCTHETAILKQDIFRRDQVWFCNKTENGNSELYGLSEFNVRKGSENIEKNYLAGKYGALPYFRKIMDNMGVE